MKYSPVALDGLYMYRGLFRYGKVGDGEYFTSMLSEIQTCEAHCLSVTELLLMEAEKIKAI